jgi:hypothetical protein
VDVGNSMRRAIAEYESGELEAAMLHTCCAVDGTAGKVHPTIRSNAARFTTLLRQNYISVVEPMVPGINLAETVFPVQIRNPSGPGRRPDFADIIYVIHRCNHGHGTPLPVGYELIADTRTKPDRTTMTVKKNLAGKWVVQLSDRAIFGMLAIALLVPENADQRIPDGYHLTYTSTTGDIRARLDNEWWGRAADFAAITAMDRKRIRLTLDFDSVMPAPPPVRPRQQRSRNHLRSRSARAA